MYDVARAPAQLHSMPFCKMDVGNMSIIFDQKYARIYVCINNVGGYQ
jgi:hypothetical protein